MTVSLTLASVGDCVMTGVIVAALPTMTVRVEVTTTPPAEVTVRRTENVPLLVNRCVAIRFAPVAASPKSHAYVQLSRQLAPFSVVFVASNVTRSKRAGGPGVQLNDTTGTLGPDNAITTDRVPDVTVPRSLTGTTVIVAAGAFVFAAGAVNSTDAVPVESVVTSFALSVPVVAVSVNRCPATAWS